MLADYRRAAAMTAEEQRRELGVAQAAFDKAPGDAARLGLALAMLLPQAGSRDDVRVSGLLTGVAAPAAGRVSARYDLAQTLLSMVAERQRAQREDQRKQDQMAHQLREERRKSEEMQQKIESLRAIDRELRLRRAKP